MGCFSFKCQKCGRGIQSDSSTGERSILFLLKKGKVLQKMTGEYDSYGRVFKQDGSSQEWDNPKDYGNAWSNVCSLMFSDDFGDGIAAFHEDCYDGVEPHIQSESDPNKGGGEMEE